jgi:hypothetical protein
MIVVRSIDKELLAKLGFNRWPDGEFYLFADPDASLSMRMRFYLGDPVAIALYDPHGRKYRGRR